MIFLKDATLTFSCFTNNQSQQAKATNRCSNHTTSDKLSDERTPNLCSVTEVEKFVCDWEITRNDVLAGRGKGVEHKEGNKFFRKLVNSFKPEHQSQKDKEGKHEVAEKVIQHVKQQEPRDDF